jgi:hypothetical protein
MRNREPEQIYVNLSILGNTQPINLELASQEQNVDLELQDHVIAVGGGTSNYQRLTNKPAIDNHELRGGNNTLEEIGVCVISNIELIQILQ